MSPPTTAGCHCAREKQDIYVHVEKNEEEVFQLITQVGT